MDIFLLLSALIASLTGTARAVVLPVAGVVQAQQGVAAGGVAQPILSARALAVAGPFAPAPHPDGYVAPRVFAPRAMPLALIPARSPERRRE